MIRSFSLLFFFFYTIEYTSAQFMSAEIGVDGFTCSMCGMSVENALRRLSFVESVEMDLNKSTAVILFRKGKDVSIQKLADQVYGSGFTVRSILADYNFPSLVVQNNVLFRIGNEELHFLGTEEYKIEGLATIVFLNKRLISKKEYTHWEGWIKQDLKKNGKKENVYYVTLWRG